MNVRRELQIRGLQLTPAIEKRGEDGPEVGEGTPDVAENQSLMSGHFAVFNVWSEIHSWEGDFLERLMPGSFTKTIAENLANVRVQFDHGYHETVGSAPLGPIDVLKEDKVGPYFEVPLLDTSYNRDILQPLLLGRLMNGENRGSQLGASFRFTIVKEEWNDEPGVSSYNPRGIPERTISEVRLFEFGPVVFPAYPEATAECGRSNVYLTEFFEERARQRRSARSAETGAAASGTPAPAPAEPPTGHSSAHTGQSAATIFAALERLKGN